MDTFGKSDPFVRLYMLPDKHEVISLVYLSQAGWASCYSVVQELKTKVIKKNLNPTFNESFQFKVSLEQVENKVQI